jgi:hypothetical protein
MQNEPTENDIQSDQQEFFASKSEPKKPGSGQKRSTNLGSTIRLCILVVILCGLGWSIWYDRMVVQPAVQDFYNVLKEREKYLLKYEAVEEIMAGRKPIDTIKHENSVVEVYSWQRPFPFSFSPIKLYLVYERRLTLKNKTEKLRFIQVTMNAEDIESLEETVTEVYPGDR